LVFAAIVFFKGGKVKTLAKLIRDEQELLKRKPSGLKFFKDATFSKRNARVECHGYVPERLRATYLLIGEYRKKLRKAESFEDKVEFASLEAGAEYRWRTELDDLYKVIKLKQFQQLGILRDWSIAAIEILIG
jgi:hypothetical protein